MDKNVGGRFFAPDALRELAPAERAAHEPQAYAKLEGLGKIAFSNIRRPKPLMEVAAARSDSPASSSSSAAGSNQVYACMYCWHSCWIECMAYGCC